MAQTRFDACVSAVAWESGLDPDRVGQDKLLIQRWINDTRREIYEMPINWNALEYVGQFQSVGLVTAGTIQATNNQAEVTGTTTSWTTGQGGDYIQIAGGAWQRISYVTDTTHLTLETSWGASSVTGQTYAIWHRYHQMPPQATRIQEIVDTSNAQSPLAYYPPWEFYQRYGLGDTFNNAVAFTIFGNNDLGLAYLTSTVFTAVTATANSPIVNFSGTFLSTALSQGDRLLIGDSTTSTAFYVDRILTDTKISLNGFLPQSIAGLSATALSLDRPLLQLFPAPNLNSVVFLYKAYKHFVDLVSNGDFLEEGWYPAIKKGAITKAAGYVRDPREKQKMMEYEAEIKNLIRAQYRVKNQNPRLKPFIRNRYGNSWVYPTDRDYSF